MVKQQDIICDAFCGVGPFALRAAKSKYCRVFASDLNPECYHYLCINKKQNKISDKLVFTDCKDGRDFIKLTLKRIEDKEIDRIDHFYMNLPPKAIEF